MRRVVVAGVAVVVAVAVGCGSQEAGEPASAMAPTEGGEDAAAEPQAAPVDAGAATTDAGAADGGKTRVADAGPVDAAAVDASSSDASTTDAAVVDAGNGTVTADGTCTVQDRPRYLSCPTGMSCSCYTSPYNRATNAPSHLDVRPSASSLAITGGEVPDNLYMPAPPAAVVALTGTPAAMTGAQPPYTVTVANGVTTIKLQYAAGYRPENFIKYTSADCGSEGEAISCTFHLP